MTIPAELDNNCGPILMTFDIKVTAFLRVRKRKVQRGRNSLYAKCTVCVEISHSGRNSNLNTTFMNKTGSSVMFHYWWASGQAHTQTHTSLWLFVNRTAMGDCDRCD